MTRKQTPDVMGDVLAARDTEQSSPPAPIEEVLAVSDSADKKRGTESRRVIHDHSVWASGIGLLPLPVVDVIALTALQIRMLSILARIYDLDFSERAVRATLAALISSNAADILHRGLVGRLFRAIPVVGWVAGIIFMPVVSGAITYAVGAVFAQHFAGGGTFFDFDIEEWKATYRHQYRHGVSMFRRRLTNGSETE